MPHFGAPVSSSNWAPVVVADTSAVKVAASRDAMRKGGSTERVPRAVDVEVVAVELPEPQAASQIAADATHRPLRILLMPVS